MLDMQKHSLADVPQSSSSKKFRNIHRKTPGLESQLQACNFIKKRLQQRSFPVKIAKFLRTAFSQNTFSGCFWTCSFLALSHTRHKLHQIYVMPDGTLSLLGYVEQLLSQKYLRGRESNEYFITDVESYKSENASGNNVYPII